MYKRRMIILMVVVGTTLSVVAARLFQLQIVGGEDYRREAAASIRSVQLLPTRRGEIVDRHGRILALDRPCFVLRLDYRFLTQDPRWVLRQQRLIARQEDVSMGRAEELYAERAENTWRLAAEVGGMTREELDEKVGYIVRRVRRIREIVGMEIREERISHPVLTGLGEGDAARLEARLGQMVGAEVGTGHVRYYPYGDSACHILGVTGEVTSDDLAERGRPTADMTLDQKLTEYLEGDYIGRKGVERSCEAALRGKRGYRRLRRVVGGYETEEEHRGEPGGRVTLTLDIALQRRLTDLFRAMTSERNLATGDRRGGASGTGAIAVISIPDGEVLALVSVPTYDLNKYRELLPDLMRDDIDYPLQNRAVTRRYPIGSTAKPVTAVAGLSSREGRGISPHTQFNCTGRMRFGRTFLHCWTYAHGMPGHGPLSIREAIQRSCNIFFYNVGARLGLEELSRWFVRAGFASPAVPALPEAVRGDVPTREWLDRNMPGYHVARPVDACQVAMGQGFLRATPVHVANAVAMIARGGEYRTPRLVLDGPEFPRERRMLPVAAGDMQAVRDGMHRAVNERGGTAYKAFNVLAPRVHGVDAYGKTGSATAVRRDLNRDGTIDSYERGRAEMSWFTGFALPESGGERGVAVSVVVEYTTGGGSRNAAPIGRETMRICQEMGYVGER